MTHHYDLGRFLIFLAMLGLTLTACETDNNHAFTPSTPDKDVKEMCLYVNGEHYDIALPAGEPVDLITLNTEFDADIQVKNASEFRQITVNGVALKDGVCSLPISKIALNEKIEIIYDTGSQLGTVHLNTMHSGIPKITASGKAEIPGQFYLSFIWRPLIMKYNNDGECVYYRYEPTDDAGTPEELGCWDFKKHIFDGKTYYSYHAPDPNFKSWAFTGYDPGMRVLLDEHYNPVDTIHALASRDGFLPEGSPLDGHDFYFFSSTHWIASASYVERDVNGTPLAVGYLQEVENGQVVFDWWTTDHPEMQEWCSSIFDTSYDYVHFNSVQVLPDDNWLCSFRVLNSIVKIDRKTGSGDILWRIDGASLDEDQSFYGQHYARLNDNTLTIFDNGCGHDPKHTRLMSLSINPETGEVLDGNDLLHDGSGYYSFACGAFQTFGNRFVAGWGWSMTDGDNDRLVSEYDANGQEIFQLRHVSRNLLLNELNSSYRCVKYE